MPDNVFRDFLKNHEELFHAVVIQSGEGISVCSTDGRYLFVNDAFCLMNGYSPKDFSKMTIREFIPPETELKLFPHVVNQQSGIREVELVKKNGERFWVETRGYPIKIDGISYALGTIHDITKRKAVERQLKESEEKFRAAFHTSPSAINLNRLKDGVFVEINRGFTEIMGYCPADVIGKSPMELGAWRKDEDRKAIVRQLQENGRVDDFEAEFVTKSGDAKIGLMSARIVDIAGEQLILSNTRDITSKRQSEKVMALLEFAINHIKDTVCLVDESGRFVYVNDAVCEHLGYTREALLQTNIMQIDPEFSVERWQQHWHQLNMSGSFNFESVHRRKDGTMYPVEVASSIFSYGGTRYSLGLARNISERRRNEEELRRLRNYLSNIIDSMPSMIVAVDSDGKVTQWNHQTEQTTGLSFEEARSQPLTKVFPYLAGEMERIKTSIRDQRVISAPKVSRKLEQEIRYEDITIFPLVTNGVEGAVIRMDDVTQQVRLEEMMIQSEKMLSVGGLAAGMAHEINNPLAGILQSAAILENRLLGDLPANRRAAADAGITLDGLRAYLTSRKLPDMIGNIRESGARAAEIVSNMLSFVRKSNRIVDLQDLEDLLDRTVELVCTDYDMKKRYDFKQIQITREYDSLLPSIPCEANKLQQVFMNILKNGAEAMAETADANDPPAFVLRVEIEDNGPGMDDNTRRRIFEPFFTTKPVGFGTGIGLSVSYFIIAEDHGGEMRVETVDGGGSCFVIRLPKKGKA